MKTFYVLRDGSYYLHNDLVLMENNGVAIYTEYLGEAMQFESLPQALEFMDLFGLQLEVLKVENRHFLKSGFERFERLLGLRS